MSGPAEVLVVLTTEVVPSREAVSALRTEAGRLARTLGGGVATVELGAVSAAAAAEALAAHVSAIGPRTVLMLDGDVSRELAPRLAAAVGTSAVLGCTGIAVEEGVIVYSKPVYGGRLEQRFSYRDGALEVVTLVGEALSPAASDEASVTEAAAGGGLPAGGDAAAAVVVAEPLGGTPPGGEPVPSEAPTASEGPAVRRLGVVPPDYRTVDIVHAARIVAAGMGTAGHASSTGADDDPAPATPGTSAAPAPEETGSPAAYGLLAYVRELAALVEGSMATTRPMVDEGRLPKERLVGQTGKTVAPDLYLALGISGSPHHVAGIQGAGTIIAVDRDPAAPIFGFADTGYVADLGEVLPALVTRIEEWRDGGR